MRRKWVQTTMHLQADCNMNANASNSRRPDVVADKVRMPFLDDKEDLEAYLRLFERFARMNRWEEDTWANHLGILLKGKAREVYAHMSDEDAGDYHELKRALLHHFQLKSEAYRKKFRAAKRGGTESYKEYTVS